MRVLAGKAAERAVNKLEGRASRLEEVEPAVNQIIHGVRKDGDKALVRYATLWDNLHKGQALRVPQQEIDEAWKATPLRTRKALKHAAANIRRFANWQLPRPWQRKISGGELGQVVRPLRSAGCYVPGGRYPLPSTLLMTAIPAQVAGVERIVVVTPNPQPATLAAAHLVGDQRGLPLWRSASDRSAGVRHREHRTASTRLSGRATRTSPRRRNW